MEDRWLLILSVLPISVYSLSCYICGDSNLDEFGECATQFQYDCQSYASRFSSDETIYCRTTRHRASNNTYTIMKECISEQDHYHTFPNKGYPIDEECDLVDVQGQEVAYCLCRNENLCNKPPIADQFIAFEEKHPELFGDEVSSSSSVPSGQAPIAIPIPTPAKIGFGAPSVPPPPIIPVNDPRLKQPKIETEIRRAQLPTREKLPDVPLPSVDTPITPENINFVKLPSPPSGQGNFIGNVGSNHQAVAVAAPPAPPHSAKKELKCAQCGESGLRSEVSDCEHQAIVRCEDSDAVCFTRQILLGPGQNAVEKMCASWKSIESEFPSAVLDSCADSNEGRVRFCTCTSDECNSMSISLQITKDFPVEMLPPHGAETGAVQTSGNSIIRTKSSEGSASKSDGVIVPIQSARGREDSVMDITAAQPLSERTGNPDHSLREHAGGELPGSDSSREQSTKARKTPLPPPIEPVQSNKKVLRCITCIESEMNDPTADCSSSAPAACSPREEFCLTKQSQNDDGSFTMEKGCVTRVILSSLMDSTDVKTGCATASGGMVNYCVCQGDSCNKESLLSQAQITGVRKSESPPKTKTPTVEPFPEVDAHKPQQPSVDMPTVFLDNDEAPRTDTAAVPEVKMTDEERELIARQKEWAEADLTGLSSAFFSIFVPVVVTVVLL